MYSASVHARIALTVVVVHVVSFVIHVAGAAAQSYHHAVFINTCHVVQALVGLNSVTVTAHVLEFTDVTGAVYVTAHVLPLKLVTQAFEIVVHDIVIHVPCE